MSFRAVMVILYCLFSAAYGPSASWSKDYARGALKIDLSSRWTVSEEPGPELLKATLATDPTVSLSIWKYNSGSMTGEQFLSIMRSDLGWTPTSNEVVDDRRFGRVNIGEFQSVNAFNQTALKIRSYDFILNGEIHVLSMIAPSDVFQSIAADIRSVFDGLASSPTARSVPAAPRPAAIDPSRGASEWAAQARREQTPAVVAPPAPPVVPTLPAAPVTRAATPAPSPAPSQVMPSPAFYYELSDGRRLGFDVVKGLITVTDLFGVVKTSYPFTGRPYISPLGLFILSEEYAYLIDPATGGISAREPLAKLFPKTPSPPSREMAVAVQPSSSSPSRSQGDPVRALMERAAGMRVTLGVRHAIEFMMNERPTLEASGSPHLYEFYFRLGEYWEEAGDLETALAYYRLATKAID